jgi:hypothetical protein
MSNEGVTRKAHKMHELDLVSQCNELLLANFKLYSILEGRPSLLSEQHQQMLRFGLSNIPPKPTTPPDLRMKRIEKKAPYQRKSIDTPHPHDVLW